jgi:DNA-binding GntR family transcriptional regulator
MEKSLAEQAYELIKEQIIICELEPGQQIVQARLAEQTGIGLTPVREALQRLARDGFVQAIPRYGFIVSPVTYKDVHEIFELRSIVESSAASLAAVRGSEVQLEELAKHAGFTYIYRDRPSYVDFLQKNVEFHRSIAVASGNQRLVELITRLLDEMTRIFHLGLDLRDSAEEMRDEHVALVKALRDRNPEQAVLIAQGQIERSQQRILEALVGRGDPGRNNIGLQNSLFTKIR